MTLKPEQIPEDLRVRYEHLLAVRINEPTFTYHPATYNFEIHLIERIATLQAEVERLSKPVTELLDAMETCHICKGTVLVEGDPVHCEDCSFECEEHEEPECTPIYELHRRVRLALASRKGSEG